ncbi:hypothetical protein ACJRO7_018803 [Eucalyptus globulus]|uniref:KIB1-4 beta-propeller domain-containing protein n=1 Tax=Eucalyptus globulus TaxID=34317 RepID=A0ABD3KV03_EUCGL
MEKGALAVVKQKQRSYHHPPPPESYHNPSPPGNRPCPWLAICHGREVQRLTFYDISEDRHHTKIIPNLHDKLILVPLSREWLFVEDQDSDDCSLWNPTSLEKIRLLPLEDLACSSCFLSSSPSDPQSYVLVIDVQKDVIGYCKPCEDTFKKHNVEPSISCATIQRVKFLDVEVSRIDINWSNPGCIPAYRDYLISSSKDLSIVNYRFTIFWMNFREGTWEELKDISFYLVKKNAIYFVQHDDQHIHTHHLENQSISKASPYLNIDYCSFDLQWIIL